MARGLVTQKNAHIIFYGNEEHKQIIEATGSQFKCYSHFPTDKIQKTSNDPNYQPNFLPIFTDYLIEMTSKLLPELIKTVNEEKPDLIIYDSISVHAKYLIEYLRMYQSNHRPASVIFSPTFTTFGGVYPNFFERQLNHEKHGIFYYIYLLKANIRQIRLCLKFGLKLNNPVKFLSYVNDTELNLVAIFPELQARSSLCSKNVKFVGSCVSEEVRSIQSLDLDKSLLNVFEMFEEKNPIQLDVDDYFLSDSLFLKKKKLIYVSLGTLFNSSFQIYDKILDSFRNFNQYVVEKIGQLHNFSLEDVHLVISCGNEVYNLFQAKIISNEYSLPENVLLLKSAPQIDILKVIFYFQSLF